MSQFDKELSIRLQGIEDKDLRRKIKNSFMGKLMFKTEINELKEKDEFKTFLNNWEYDAKIICNLKLWKSSESNFFNLENSYFILETPEELNTFKIFLEKECQKNIQQQQSEFSESDIIGIYEEFLMNYNPIDNKEKILNALKDVLTNNIKASYENIKFLTKDIKIKINKIEWYSKLGLSDDQVSVIYQKTKLCDSLPDYKDTILGLAVNKFKLIAHNHISGSVKKNIIARVKENPHMTKKEIENIINSYRVFNENDIDNVLNNLKILWPELDSKTKKDISFQLYKIKEKITQ